MLPKGLLKEYSRAITITVGMIDMLTIFVAGWLAYVLRFDELQMPQPYVLALVTAFFAAPFVFNFCNIYTFIRGKSFINNILTLLQAVCLLGFILAGLAFFTKSGEIFSRSWFGIWMAMSLALLILFRGSLLLVLRFMRARGLNERRVVIIGAGELGMTLAGTIQHALWTGFQVKAFIDDEAHTKPKTINNIPVISMPASLSHYLTQTAIDEIWIALPLGAEARVKEILFELRHQTITTRFVLDIFGLDLMNHSITEIAGFPVLNIRSSPMHGINRFIKAVEDRVIAALILIIISPVLLMIMLAVKCSSKGPVFFKQQRLGWDGRIIKVYKFRTMLEHQEEAGKITQASAQDVRVTRLGKFLRKTSLDELPQFLNVLQGRMSIVGPRPHALAHNELYKDMIHTYMQRHRVKPGITGWAQVNGWRGETDTLDKMKKRVEYDLFYINNWSLIFDLKIIFLTLFKGFNSPNAY